MWIIIVMFWNPSLCYKNLCYPRTAITIFRFDVLLVASAIVSISATKRSYYDNSIVLFDKNYQQQTNNKIVCIYLFNLFA